MRKLDGHGVEARAYAAELTAELLATLDGALAGAYLHGSAALGGWNADRSDVDILFVTAGDPAPAGSRQRGDGPAQRGRRLSGTWPGGQCRDGKRRGQAVAAVAVRAARRLA